jgi:serine/threonine protein kinase
MLPLTPTKLGRYEIVDEIGKGAMGVVFLARDPLIGRLVALKTFRIGYSVKDQEMEQFRIRFMREAQSAGILTHPNIVTIHDVVEASDDGLAFIAMEYVRGTNLKLMLQGEQPLSLAGVLDVIAQVGDALDYAHANRVVHRDVKPANILITTDNKVKITDFGIARLDSSNLTQEGQLLGTPNYMAPEQIQGREVDHRADLFSLGVVLYEMLTRHKPFQGENLTVVSHRIVYDHFTPLRDYVRDLPPGVDRILGRALEKDPAKRYQRGREMVDDLRRVVEATAVAGDSNETQSLSSTMVLPPAPIPPPPLPPAAAAAPPVPPKASFLSRLRAQPAAVPPPAPVPPTAAAEGTSATGTAATGGSWAGGSWTGGAATGTGGSGITSASTLTPPPFAPVPPADPLADTVATVAPVLVKPRRISPLRLLVTAGIAAAVALLCWAAALFWLGRALPDGPRRNADEDGLRARVLTLVHEGNEARRVGNWGGAQYFFLQAEALAPRAKGIHRMRLAADQSLATQSSQLSQAAQIPIWLSGANQALAAQSWDAALAAAAAVLNLDPANAEARAITVKAQEGLTRKNRPRSAPAPQSPRPGQETAVATPVTSEGPAPHATPAPARSEATTATVRIHFRSDLPEATVIVYANRKEIFRKDFGGGGLFHRAQEPLDVTESRPVPTGIVEFLVSVTPHGRAAIAQKPSGNFPGGASRDLEIHLTGPKDLDVRLR